MRIFGKPFKEWFTVSRVLVTVGNIVFFCYHFFWIGIDGYVSVIIQIIALIIEYLVSGIYEKLLLRSNRKINELTRRIKKRKWLVQLPTKTLLYIFCFLGIYISTYFLRLYFFYLVEWGMTYDHMIESMRNSLMASPILGIIMGSIVVWRKKKNLKKRNKGAHV
jgi:DMSO/TMAO reductase YedYZ heme-binding membrane subunit